MKVLIIGGSGSIGGHFVSSISQEGYGVSYTYFSKGDFVLPQEGVFKLDITNKNNTINLVKKIRPEILIHASALTNVDLCETDKSLAYNINIKGTKHIVEACKVINSKIIFLSTSNVFDGKKDLYYECDDRHAINNYGLSKLAAENIVMSSGLQYLILRTDQPYHWIKPWQKKNSVIRVLEKLEANQNVNDIIDWYNTPTFIGDIADVVIKLLDMDKTGVYHVVGSDFVNRYEFALLIAKTFGKDESLVHPITSEQLQLAATRANAHLSNKKVLHELGIRISGIKEGLEKMKSYLDDR